VAASSATITTVTANGVVSSSADIGTVDVETLVVDTVRETVTATTGKGGGGAVVSTALAASGFHSLTSTSTTGSTGAGIFHLVTAVAGDNLSLAICTVPATSTPFKIYTSSSAAWWDSTSQVITMSTAGASLHVKAQSASQWVLVGGAGYTLAATS